MTPKVESMFDKLNHELTGLVDQDVLDLLMHSIHVMIITEACETTLNFIDKKSNYNEMKSYVLDCLVELIKMQRKMENGRKLSEDNKEGKENFEKAQVSFEL